MNPTEPLDRNTWRSGTNQTASRTAFTQDVCEMSLTSAVNSQKRRSFLQHHKTESSQHCKNNRRYHFDQADGFATYSRATFARLEPNYCHQYFCFYTCVGACTPKQMAFACQISLKETDALLGGCSSSTMAYSGVQSRFSRTEDVTATIQGRTVVLRSATKTAASNGV